MRSLAFFALLAAPSLALANSHGMTWATYGHDSAHGADKVGCSGGSMACNAYHGETSCNAKLPVLCIAVDGSPDPGVAVIPFYSEWAEGVIATSRRVVGTDLTSLAAGDAICAQQFGSQWRMAEFHDGEGWGFWAYGYVRNDTRFWVYIDDQPANCWD